MLALLAGPHGPWAAREITARFRHGRRFDGPPPDMPGYTPRGGSRRGAASPSPRPPERGEPARVEAFVNRNPASRLRGHAPGDGLELIHAAERTDLAHLTPEGVAQRVLDELSPALCIGDVVSCRPAAAARRPGVPGAPPDQSRAPWSLAVERRGFAPVSPPAFAREDPAHADPRREAEG